MLTYDWNVNIPDAALSTESVWVFRFVPFGAAPPFADEVSSAGVDIAGPEKASTSSASSLTKGEINLLTYSQAQALS
jgi:hypothetical protein